MELITAIRPLFTVIVIATFIGIVIWAYVPARAGAFERAARMPLEEDDHDPSRDDLQRSGQ